MQTLRHMLPQGRPPPCTAPDAELLSGGILRARDLCAFRAGELVRDETLERIVPLPGELVKIAAPHGSRPDDWTCRFLTEKNLCFIHGTQPIECRAFYCEAPEALLALSGKDSLDRKAVRALLKAPEWWDELMDAHAEHCAYGALTELAPRIADDAEARRAFLEIVEYDRAFRELAVEKKAAQPDELDFLLGPPAAAHRDHVRAGRPPPAGRRHLSRADQPQCARGSEGVAQRQLLALCSVKNTLFFRGIALYPRRGKLSSPSH